MANTPNKFEAFCENAWKRIKQIFSKVEHEGPAVVATVNEAIPYAELVFAAVSPAEAAVVNPIVTEVQGDLTTISNAAKNGAFASIPAFLASCCDNIDTICTEAHIKDPASLAKATAAASAFKSLLNSVLSVLPAAATTGAGTTAA